MEMTSDKTNSNTLLNLVSSDDVQSEERQLHGFLYIGQTSTKYSQVAFCGFVSKITKGSRYGYHPEANICEMCKELSKDIMNHPEFK